MKKHLPRKIMILILASILTQASICNDDNGDEFLTISGRIFELSGEDTIAPQSNASITLESGFTKPFPVGDEYFYSPSNPTITTDSKGRFKITIGKGTSARVTVRKEGFTEQIIDLGVVNEEIYIGGFQLKRNPEVYSISPSGGTIDAFAYKPAGKIEVPEGAVSSNISGIKFTPFHLATALPKPLPEGYVPIAGADFCVDITVEFASGEEPEVYIIKPKRIEHSTLESAQIVLLQFINGEWIKMPGKAKLITSGILLGYIGPDPSDPAKLRGIYPLVYAAIVSASSTIKGDVKDNAGNPIPDSVVFDWGRCGIVDKRGHYRISNASVIGSNTLMPIHIISGDFSIAKFITLFEGEASSEDFSINLQDLTEMGIIGGSVKDAKAKEPIISAKVQLGLHSAFIKLEYDSKGTAELSDDTFGITPPAGVSITQYRWKLSFPDAQEDFTSKKYTGPSIKINDLAIEAQENKRELVPGGYTIYLEIEVGTGRWYKLVGGFKFEQVGFETKITFVTTPAVMNKLWVTKTNEEGNYRFLDVPLNVLLQICAEAGGYEPSGWEEIGPLSEGETVERNFGLSVPVGQELAISWSKVFGNVSLSGIGDVDNDGNKEVIALVAENDKANLMVYDFKGDILWEKSIMGKGNFTVMDVTGTSSPEIIVAYRDSSDNLKALIYSGDGILLKAINRGPSGYDSSWRLLHVKGEKLFFGCSAGYSLSPRGLSICSYSSGEEIGKYLIGPAVWIGGTGMWDPVVEDINSDGLEEIAFSGSTVHNGASANNTDDS